jgi:hypothetical protein
MPSGVLYSSRPFTLSLPSTDGREEERRRRDGEREERGPWRSVGEREECFGGV